MKRFFGSVIFSLMIIAITQGVSTASTSWEKSFGGLSLSSFATTTDGGVIFVAKNRLLQGQSTAETTLVKLDQYGHKEWNKSVFDETGNYAQNIIQLADGNYLYATSDRKIVNYSYDGYVKIVKFGIDGTILWSKTIGTSTADSVYSLSETSDGGFVIGSQTGNFPYYIDTVVYKFDTNGNLEWSNKINENVYDQLQSVQELSDGSFLTVVSSHYRGVGKTYIVKIGNDGSLLWAKHDENNPFTGTLFIPTSDAGFLKHDNYKGITKFNANGEAIWTRFYTYESGSTSTLPISSMVADKGLDNYDKGYVLTGPNITFKIDTSGEILWVKNYPQASSKNNVKATVDGGYIRNIMRGTDLNTSFVKIDGNGDLLGCGLDFGEPQTIYSSVIENPNYVDSGYVFKNLSVYEGLGVPETVELFPSEFVDYASCVEDFGVVVSSVDNIYFGSVELNTSVQESFEISNVGNNPFGIFEIKIFNSESEFINTNDCPRVLIPGQSCSINVTFTPPTESYYSRTFRAQTNVTSSDVYLRGNGVDSDRDDDGYERPEDCDDNNPAANPGMTEIPYNGFDDDCDASTLDDDFDFDGWLKADDCDDSNPAMNPGMTEVPYNGLDDDCNASTLDDDFDFDGWLKVDDCDDNNPAANPAMTEVAYNGFDDDCNASTLDDDLDQDGWLNADDCNDDNAGISPSAYEIFNNGIDENCNGLEDDTQAEVIVDSATDTIAELPVEALLPPDSLGDANDLNNAENLLGTLQNKINGVSNKLATINDTLTAEEKLVIYNECLVVLDDIIKKTDGFYGGNPSNDWITTQEGQDLLYPQLLNAINFVQGEIDKLVSP